MIERLAELGFARQKPFDALRRFDVRCLECLIFIKKLVAGA